MPDIYFAEKFAQINLDNDNDEVILFETYNEYGHIKHLFIKRRILDSLSDVDYYDLITPYGYGGPIILNSTNEKKLMIEFKKDFEKYCRDNNIVSEFIRFHPIIKNYETFEEIYDPIFMRNTVGTNLDKFDDPVQQEFSRSCRKSIRQTLEKNVTYEVIEKPNIDNIQNFIKIYYSTMDRNNASDFYYFKKEYFIDLINSFKDKIVIVEARYENQVIAAGFYFIYDKFIHLHLSGTLSEFLYLSPAYILRYAITVWGKENGFGMIHHGGGTTNDPNDGLLQFKKRFGKNTQFDYYVAKKIWNEEVYLQLASASGNEDSSFFPKYRDKQ